MFSHAEMTTFWKALNLQSFDQVKKKKKKSGRMTNLLSGALICCQKIVGVKQFERPAQTPDE